MTAEVMVITTVVIIEHLAAGSAPVPASDGLQSDRSSLGTETAGNPAGGFGQSFGVLHAINSYQIGNPLLKRPLNVQNGRRLHLVPHSQGDAASADLDTLGLQPDLGCGPQGVQAHGQAVLKMLTAGLGRQPETAETAAPMVGQAFKINDRDASLLKLQKQVGFTRTGPSAQ